MRGLKRGGVREMAKIECFVVRACTANTATGCDMAWCTLSINTARSWENCSKMTGTTRLSPLTPRLSTPNSLQNV